MEKNKLSIIVNRMIENQNYLKNFINTNKSLAWGSDPLSRNKSKFVKYGLAFSEDGVIYNLCDESVKDCKKKKLNQNQSINLLRGEYKENNKIYYYLGKSYIESKYGKIENSEKKKIYNLGEIFLRYF